VEAARRLGGMAAGNHANDLPASQGKAIFRAAWGIAFPRRIPPCRRRVARNSNVQFMYNNSPDRVGVSFARQSYWEATNPVFWPKNSRFAASPSK